MKNNVTALSVTIAALLLSGCGGNGGGNSLAGAVPPTTKATIAPDVLQVAVGTAYNANDATTGLNVVPTFRQGNGSSAVLANTPTLSGPSGFTVPALMPGAYSATNTDGGTNHISASPQVNIVTAGSNTTLGTFTGVFSYGFAPLNSDSVSTVGYFPGNPNSTGVNGFTGSTYDNFGSAVCGFTPTSPPAPPAVPPCAFNAPTNGFPGGLPWWPQPLGDQANLTALGVYLIGPPAVPFFNNGTYPGGFAGYSPGFTFFEAPPVVGTYSLGVAVTIANAPSQSFTATSNKLTKTAPLPAPVLSGVVENGGGLTGTVTAGTGATETLVFIQDASAGLFYTVGPIAGTGAQPFTLPATLGPCNGAGCQNGAATQSPSIAAGDYYVVTAISFDYPAFEAGPPGNVQESPTLTGTAGQADLSIGVQVTGSY